MPEHTELLNTPKVMIEPFSSYVDEASKIVNQTNPGLLDNISDIRINLSKGVFGEYESSSPSTVWINMGKLESEVRSKLSGQSEGAIRQEIINQVAETIVHESQHKKEFETSGASSEAGPERAEEEFRNKRRQIV
jgi:hypothetical protein